jgi:hypothetical protein
MSQKIIRSYDGTIVRIEPFTGKEDAREFQRFINALTREGTYLLMNKLVTLDEEKKVVTNANHRTTERTTASSESTG